MESFRSRVILAFLAATAAAQLVDAFTFAPTSGRRNGLVLGVANANIDQMDLDTVLSDPMFIEPLSGTSSPNGIKDGKTPDELIAIAKRFLVTSKGLGGDPNMLADSFQFEGPVVGPLSKDAFVKAIGSVDFDTAFPNWTPQFYGFFVDPLEEDGNRVWYTAKGYGVNEGPLLPFAPEATNLTVENPPQVCSITIDHKTGLITRYTIGYVTDRNVGNTGGLGGLYGILYALGKPLPFPEAQPWKQSWQYSFFQKIGSLVDRS